ncbi:CPBP family intramembrane glutamic endopeptidase [Oceanivirga miroungae]|uniref:CAAX prenyl protease 2/Lysostaphin resistance protein A-like domain-containing protein n=1 Tax=Oceanivirga miroungae TaxID=1130046 RepID=A0A6I8M6D7_9FUSO|nr:type II CAAX endopeptidase family protein [Oceanivirga miroungae]VWL85004.1 hypothetical protein OMES3154_00276 [Oceanivirga miroungae]
MTKNQRIAVITTVIYTLIMSMGMFVMHNIVGLDYSNSNMVYTLVYFEIAMTILTIVVYRKYFKNKAFNKPKNKPRKIFLFVFAVMILGSLVLAYQYFINATYSPTKNKLLLMAITTTMLVGFSEELMYRGIVLPAFLENHSKFKTILISSAFFSSLHAVNILGGFELTGVISQVVVTFFVGITFACIFTEIKSLLPLIIFHGWWDFLSIGGGAVTESKITGAITAAIVVFEILMGLIMLFTVIRKDDKIKKMENLENE